MGGAVANKPSCATDKQLLKLGCAKSPLLTSTPRVVITLQPFRVARARGTCLHTPRFSDSLRLEPPNSAHLRCVKLLATAPMCVHKPTVTKLLNCWSAIAVTISIWSDFNLFGSR